MYKPIILQKFTTVAKLLSLLNTADIAPTISNKLTVHEQTRACQGSTR